MFVFGVRAALSASSRRVLLRVFFWLGALVAFQGFRLPLELVLHAWAEAGTIPATMTWTGQNVDILSGVAALVAAPFAARHRAAAWLTSIVGALLLAFHLPYATILLVCVGGALAGHIVLLRALLRGARG